MAMPEEGQFLAQGDAGREHPVEPPALADAVVPGVDEPPADRAKNLLKLLLLVRSLGEQIIDRLLEPFGDGRINLGGRSPEPGAPQEMGRLPRIERIGWSRNERFEELRRHGNRLSRERAAGQIRRSTTQLWPRIFGTVNRRLPVQQ